MTDVIAIGALPPVTLPLDGTEETVVTQNGTTARINISQIGTAAQNLTVTVSGDPEVAGENYNTLQDAVDYLNSLVLSAGFSPIIEVAAGYNPTSGITLTSDANFITLQTSDNNDGVIDLDTWVGGSYIFDYGQWQPPKIRNNFSVIGVNNLISFIRSTGGYNADSNLYYQNLTSGVLINNTDNPEDLANNQWYIKSIASNIYCVEPAAQLGDISVFLSFMSEYNTTNVNCNIQSFESNSSFVYEIQPNIVIRSGKSYTIEEGSYTAYGGSYEFETTYSQNIFRFINTKVFIGTSNISMAAMTTVTSAIYEIVDTDCRLELSIVQPLAPIDATLFLMTGVSDANISVNTAITSSLYDNVCNIPIGQYIHGHGQIRINNVDGYEGGTYQVSPSTGDTVIKRLIDTTTIISSGTLADLTIDMTNAMPTEPCYYEFMFLGAITNLVFTNATIVNAPATVAAGKKVTLTRYVSSGSFYASVT